MGSWMKSLQETSVFRSAPVAGTNTKLDKAKGEMALILFAIFVTLLHKGALAEEQLAPNEVPTPRLAAEDAALLSSLVSSDTAHIAGDGVVKKTGGGPSKLAIPEMAKGIPKPAVIGKSIPLLKPPVPVAMPVPVAKPVPMPMLKVVPIKPHAPIVATKKIAKTIGKIAAGKKILTKAAVAADIKIAKATAPKGIFSKLHHVPKLKKLPLAKPKVHKLKPIVYVVEKPVKVYHKVPVPKVVMIPKFYKVPKPIPVPKFIPVPVKFPVVKIIPKIVKIPKPVPIPKFIPVKKLIPIGIPVPVPKIHKVPVLKPVPYLKPIPIPIPKPYKKYVPFPIKKIIKVPKPYYVPVKVPHITKSYMKTPMVVKVPKAVKPLPHFQPGKFGVPHMKSPMGFYGKPGIPSTIGLGSILGAPSMMGLGGGKPGIPSMMGLGGGKPGIPSMMGLGGGKPGIPSMMGLGGGKPGIPSMMGLGGGKPGIPSMMGAASMMGLGRKPGYSPMMGHTGGFGSSSFSHFGQGGTAFGGKPRHGFSRQLPKVDEFGEEDLESILSA